MSGLVQVAAPAIEPITLDDARLYLRMDGTSYDAPISQCIKAARQYIEASTKRALIEQQWDLFLDRFPSPTASIYLDYPPIISVDSISYYDGDGVVQTLATADYLVDTATEPARITPGVDLYWPETQTRVNAVTVRYTAGYGDEAGEVPEGLRQAIRNLVELWIDRDSSLPATSRGIPFGVQSLVNAHRWGDYS